MEAVRNAADQVSRAVYGFYQNLYKLEPDAELQAKNEATFAACDTGLAGINHWQSANGDGEVDASDPTQPQIAEEAARISKDVQDGKFTNKHDLDQFLGRLNEHGWDDGDDEDAMSQDSDDEKDGSNDDALFSEDQEEWIRDLHHGLERQLSQCTCQQSHLARLRLPLSDADGKDPSFEVFFSYHQDEWGWIRSKCTLLRSDLRLLLRLVASHGGSRADLRRSYLEAQEKRGCEFIRNALNDNTSLDIFVERAMETEAYQPEQPSHATGKGTVQLRTSASPNERIRGKARPVVSLRDLIKPNHKSVQVTYSSEKFLPLHREHLCWNLGLGFLHLGKDEWKSLQWYMIESGIFFLRDPASGKLCDKANPYLSWTIEKRPKSTNNGNQRTDDQASLVFHLLNFGRLLLEVYTWKDLQFSTSMNFTDARLDLLKLAKNELGRDSWRFKAVIEACLNEAAQKAAQRQDLRNYVYKNIVLPLRRYRNTSPRPEELPPQSSDRVSLFDHQEVPCSQYLKGFVLSPSFYVLSLLPYPLPLSWSSISYFHFSLHPPFTCYLYAPLLLPNISAITGTRRTNSSRTWTRICANIFAETQAKPLLRLQSSTAESICVCWDKFRQ